MFFHHSIEKHKFIGHHLVYFLPLGEVLPLGEALLAPLGEDFLDAPLVAAPLGEVFLGEDFLAGDFLGEPFLGEVLDLAFTVVFLGEPFFS